MRRMWLWLLERLTRLVGRMMVRRRATDDAAKRPPRRDMYPMW